MRFVIDETSWKFDGLSTQNCLEELEILLDNIEFEMEQGQPVCYSEDLFHSPVLGNLLFYQLYDSKSSLPIPWSVRERIAILFSRLQKWQDFPDWPPSFDVRVGPGSALESAPSIAWAHQRSRNNRLEAVACLVFPAGRQSGLFEVEVSAVVFPIWFISRQDHCIDFFRWLIRNYTTSPNQMEVLAGSAFPGLNFVQGAFNGIKHMSKPYKALLPSLVHHLSVFSDHGKEIFLGPHADAPAKFGAMGLNVSDENGGTKSNGEAKKDHTRTYLGEEIQFWWHSKFEIDRDRIHLDPMPINKNGKITIGIFCRHLLV